jgi:hypothetical protein
MDLFLSSIAPVSIIGLKRVVMVTNLRSTPLRMMNIWLSLRYWCLASISVALICAHSVILYHPHHIVFFVPHELDSLFLVVADSVVLVSINLQILISFLDSLLELLDLLASLDLDLMLSLTLKGNIFLIVLDLLLLLLEVFFCFVKLAAVLFSFLSYLLIYEISLEA